MRGVEVLQISGKEIIYINYSGCKPREMITVFDEAKQIVLAKTGGCLLLTNFGDCFITALFMEHARKEMPTLAHLIKKNAFIEMTTPQKMILKGFRFFIGEDHYTHFETQQEAIDYLIRE